jgi:SH3-like domain-containing protein
MLTRYRLMPVALLALWAALSATAWARDMVSVDRPVLNMRSGPGTDKPILWALAQGFPLEVLGRQGRWLRVQDFEGDLGWVYQPLVNRTPHVIVKSRSANLRSTPSTRSRVRGKVVYGEVLRTLEQRKAWVRVQRQSGTQGWIYKKLIWGW